MNLGAIAGKLLRDKRVTRAVKAAAAVAFTQGRGRASSSGRTSRKRRSAGRRRG